MRAAIFNGPGSSRSASGPTRSSRNRPTPSCASCWPACAGPTSGTTAASPPHAVGSIGHEFIGVVEDVGADVHRRRAAAISSIAPFIFSDGTCPHCRHGSTDHCVAGGNFGNGTHRRRPGRSRPRPARRRHPRHGARLRPLRRDAALAAHAVRRHVAPATTPRSAPVSSQATPWPWSATAPSACPPCSPPQRLGAERIIALSRNPARQATRPRVRRHRHRRGPRRRGQRETILELTGGIGVDAAMECVGTEQSMTTAFSDRPARLHRRRRRCPSRRRGSVPRHRSSATSAGAAAPPRPAATSPSCSTTSSPARINPGLVLDFETDLDHIAEAYAAMDDRRAIKSLVRVGSP